MPFCSSVLFLRSLVPRAFSLPDPTANRILLFILGLLTYIFLQDGACPYTFVVGEIGLILGEDNTQGLSEQALLIDSVKYPHLLSG